MAYTHKIEYEFTEDQQEKVFQLILSSTLKQEINWTMGKAMLTGFIGNDKILFYSGETRTALCIQNKKEYAFFIIDSQKEEILKNAISGKAFLGYDKTKLVKNIWSGNIFQSISN